MRTILIVILFIGLAGEAYATASRTFYIPFKGFGKRAYNNAGEGTFGECSFTNVGTVPQNVTVTYLSGFNALEPALMQNVTEVSVPSSYPPKFTLAPLEGALVTWHRAWNGVNVAPAVTWEDDMPRLVIVRVEEAGGAMVGDCRITYTFSSQTQAGLSNMTTFNVNVNGGKPF